MVKYCPRSSVFLCYWAICIGHIGLIGRIGLVGFVRIFSPGKFLT